MKMDLPPIKINTMEKKLFELVESLQSTDRMPIYMFKTNDFEDIIIKYSVYHIDSYAFDISKLPGNKYKFVSKWNNPEGISVHEALSLVETEAPFNERGVKKWLKGAVSDLFFNFTYHNRKDDEFMTLDKFNSVIETGLLTEEMVIEACTKEIKSQFHITLRPVIQ